MKQSFAETLVAALKIGGIQRDVVAASRDEVLEYIASTIGLPEGVCRESLKHELFKREGDGSTGLGYGWAFPHARWIPKLDVPVAAVLILRTPVDWLAFDRRPVHTLLVRVCRDPAASTVLAAGITTLAQRWRKDGQVPATDEGILQQASELLGPGRWPTSERSRPEPAISENTAQLEATLDVEGLHVRVAMAIAGAVRHLDASLAIEVLSGPGGSRVGSVLYFEQGASPMDLMHVPIPQNATLRITCSGRDAATAAEAVRERLKFSELRGPSV